MEKIKVYNLDSYFRKEFNKIPHFFDKVAIFVGDNGIVIADDEAVRKISESLEFHVKFDLKDIPVNNIYNVIPQYIAELKVSDLLNAEYEEMDLKDFFNRRKYNNRCTGNFMGLLQDLKDIKFDIELYYNYKEDWE